LKKKKFETAEKFNPFVGESAGAKGVLHLLSGRGTMRFLFRPFIAVTVFTN